MNYTWVLILVVLSTLSQDPAIVSTMSLDRRAGAALPPALYMECVGGSLAEICLTDTYSDRVVKSLNKFTPQHLFTTIGSGCKFTSWTESNGADVPMTRDMFGEIIKQTKGYCTSIGLRALRANETATNFKNVFVGTTVR
ncbi:hypothetical protein DFH28DRAFT_20896 [Melampsora americana]|nr:hypothetical protein DFH28DRAFT_20896 [Melampsora americana]